MTKKEFIKSISDDLINIINVSLPSGKIVELDTTKLDANLNEVIKEELENYTQFLLRNGYCDSDVYCEPPTAIDRYFHPKLNK